MKQVENINVVRIEPLTTPEVLKREIPASEAANRTVSEARRAIRRILRKEDPRLLVITGPCSIHDTELALDYANRLKELQARFEDRLLIAMRVYFDKPRTTVGWRGFMNDPEIDGSNNLETGLKRTRKLLLEISEMGIPVATEILDPFIPQYLSDLIAWGAIGARTTESQTHRAMVSGLSMPVGFKNSTEGNIQLAVDAIASSSRPHTFLGIEQNGQAGVVYTSGNPDCHTILRGGRAGPNYAATFTAEAGEKLRAAGLEPGLIIDCSHHNSGYDFHKQETVWNDILEQRAAGNDDLVGMMLESNIHEGKQPISDHLQYGVSLTDSCISWETTEKLLQGAYDTLPQSSEPVGA